MNETQSLMSQFASVEIQHPMYRAVLDEVTLQLECPAGSEFFAVFGPPGVGKTTLCESIFANAWKIYSSESPPAPGEMPVVLVTCPAPSRRRPDWKELFSRILEEINNPLATAPTSMRLNHGFGGNNFGNGMIGKASTQGIRRAVREAIGHRKVRLILCDEGQHMTKGLKKEDVRSEMDNLKNLAAEAECAIGFVGTYELLPFVTASGQLGRRVTPIHYPRYFKASVASFELFSASLAVFLENMPVTDESKKIIFDQKEFFYDQTLGCMGTLATVLCNICWRALRRNNGVVNADVIKRSALLAGCSRQIRVEIEVGEAAWRKLVTDSPDLGFAETEAKPSKISTGTKPQPGRPNPRRLRVGGDRSEDALVE